MIKVEQTRFGGPYDPQEESGNCFAACVASICELSINDLPEQPFIEDNHEVWSEWFTARGLGLLSVVLYDETYYPGHMGLMIAGCESAFHAHQCDEGGGHVVVMKDGEVIWNPNPRDTRSLEEITRKLDLYLYVIYPLDPAAREREQQ